MRRSSKTGSFRAQDTEQNGAWTLQLVPDEGAWEEIITLTADDVDNLQDLLEDLKTVCYVIDRRLFMFGLKKPGD